MSKITKKQKAQLLKLVGENDTAGIKAFFSDNDFNSESFADDALREVFACAVKQDAVKVIEELLLGTAPYDSLHMKDVLEVAKIGSHKIWRTLLECNEDRCYMPSWMRADRYDFERIAGSEGASDEVKLYLKYDMLDEHSLCEKPTQYNPHGIRLTHIFNFKSAQQTTIVHCDGQMSASTAAFDALSKREFYEEKYAVYKTMGGSTPNPFNIAKKTLQKPLV